VAQTFGLNQGIETRLLNWSPIPVGEGLDRNPPQKAFVEAFKDLAHAAFPQSFLDTDVADSITDVHADSNIDSRSLSGIMVSPATDS